ncbi:hypothetical protein [Streptomyces sp. NPDC056323]|uniref:hypothetical protein n=1 Tax=Streptomyces sp. NPDC056323 TaxID=3345784 RepID=UPI0035DFAAF9
MLIDYQNTLLIQELNNATNAALKQIVELTEELQTLREGRDGERQRRSSVRPAPDPPGVNFVTAPSILEGAVPFGRDDTAGHSTLAAVSRSLPCSWSQAAGPPVLLR